MSNAADVKACTNCQTTRYPTKAHGLCARCYFAQRKIEQADKWSLANLSSLKDYPPSRMYENPAALARVRIAYKKEYQRRLQFLKIIEQKLNGPIDAVDIEFQLARLAHRAGARNKNMLHGSACAIGATFGPEQRIFLYGLLNDIEENIQWKGIDWMKVLN